MKEFTCIICPRGCNITVDDDGNISGFNCIRGKHYAETETISPERTLTTFLRIKNREYTVVPVKTKKPIPKKDVIKLSEALKLYSISAPCKMGDVLVKNPLGIECEIIATKNIK